MPGFLCEAIRVVSDMLKGEALLERRRETYYGSGSRLNSHSQAPRFVRRSIKSRT